MDESAEKSDCRESTSTDNVRTRVSSWLFELVDDVRRKTSAHHTQKWTESESLSRRSTTENPSESTAIIETRKIVEEQAHSNICDDEKTISPTKFWSPGSFFNRVKGFDKLGSEPEENRAAVINLKTLGKAKINEFYDKVRISKARYNMLKNRTTMEQSTQNISERDIDEKHEDIDDELVPSSSAISFNKHKDETSLSDNNLEISDNSENFFSFNRKIPLSAIGRSSTGNSYSPPEHQQEERHEQAQPRSLISVAAMQKNLLGNIGRSFSEQNDDDDEDDNSFVLNERCRSYSQVVGERPTSNSSNVSSSLPTFFGHKSVPVSPVPQYKGVISREASFSESPRRRSLLRDSSVQSDSSHCSSVESLLEARKPDPEAILVNLGFGPVQSDDILSKIPKRFLKPSQVKGIDTEAFLRQQQMANHLHDHSVLGYRGLLGNPDIPPSLIVAKIMERFELNQRNRYIMDINMNRPQSAPPTPGPNQ